MSDTDDLIAENARLAARVAELEAQLASKPAIDRASLFRMVNHAPWAVMAVNSQWAVDYANPGFAPWMSVAPPAVGVALAEAALPPLFEIIEWPIRQALRGEHHESEVSLRNADGEARELRLSVQPRGDPPTGAVVTLYDQTETKATDRAVRENEARLAHITAVNPSLVYIYDVETWDPVWAAGAAEDIYGYDTDALLSGGGELIRALIHPDDLSKVPARLKDLAAHPDGYVQEFELRIRHPAGAYRWILDRGIVFERAPNGRITKTLSAAIDIDERKRAEERRSLLINELNHRVKNTLASVQSIARQTLRSGRPAAAAIDDFTARIVALSSAHDVLTQAHWEGADLRAIADGALRPFGGQDGRIAIEGPPVRLPARAALGIAMALHELATNALKYGALSREGGQVHLTWRVRALGPGGRLDLEWREAGGPPVPRRIRRGFGARLLTQGLPAELGGVAELEFAPGGVVCHIAAPLEDGPPTPGVG